MKTTALAFSGGMDSSMLLWDLLAEGGNIRCVFVDYGQPAAKQEKPAAERIVTFARNYLNPGQSIDLKCVRVAGFPKTQIPARGVATRRDFAHYAPLVMSTVVAHGIASGADVIASAVSVAAVVGDADWVMAHMFTHLDSKLAFSFPYVERTKSWILERGRRSTIGLSLWHVMPWSCLLGGKVHCGRCRGCKSRQAAFRDVAVADRTE